MEGIGKCGNVTIPVSFHPLLLLPPPPQPHPVSAVSVCPPQQRASKEVEMMYVKGQYETDNIVVASLEAQVKALQSQLSQVTGHAR